MFITIDPEYDKPNVYKKSRRPLSTDNDEDLDFAPVDGLVIKSHPDEKPFEEDKREEDDETFEYSDGEIIQIPQKKIIMRSASIYHEDSSSSSSDDDQLEGGDQISLEDYWLQDQGNSDYNCYNF